MIRTVLSVVKALDNRLGKAGVSVLVSGGLLLALNGVAAAYLAENGHVSHTGGTGTATVAAAKTITPSASSISGTLYPGGTADLKITISNPYTNLSLTLTGVVSAAAVTGCITPGVNIATPTGISPSVLAAGATNVQVTFSGAIQMTTSSSTDCQGGTLTVPVAVTTKVG